MKILTHTSLKKKLDQIWHRMEARIFVWRKARREWHPHFAWIPRRVDDHTWIWLEWIQRRKTRYYISDVPFGKPAFYAKYRFEYRENTHG